MKCPTYASQKPTDALNEGEIVVKISTQTSAGVYYKIRLVEVPGCRVIGPYRRKPGSK